MINEILDKIDVFPCMICEGTGSLCGIECICNNGYVDNKELLIQEMALMALSDTSDITCH